jgi:two-component system, cell cycle sensor histidine kinase and response regulator CckA
MKPRRSSRWAQRLLFPATVSVIAANVFVEILLPHAIERWLELATAILLLVGSILWVRALRAAAAARDELCSRLQAHHQTERELVRSEERLALAQTIARIGTWDNDLATGKVVWSDSLRMLYGVGADVVPAYERFLELVHPDDVRRIKATIDSAHEHGGDFEVEHRLRPVDGETPWLLSRGRAIPGEDGGATRVLGVTMDISERKTAEAEREKLERQLRHAQKLEAVGRLAGGIAHDFNNLLLAIRGYGEIALRAHDRGEDTHDELREIVAAAERAAALTRQLLAFSRQQVLRPEILDLNRVVGEMEKLLRRVIGEEVELEALVSANEVFVDLDRSQLEQVILNLAVNARDAMPNGGRLTLEVGFAEGDVDLQPGPFALLAVRDTGCGMDPEIMTQIFDPFFTTKSEGTGLGLATVHGIVKQSGGSIWVYSEVAQGTTFKIYFPLSDQARTPPVGLTLPPAATMNGETILLVEDDPQVRMIVARMLEVTGYRVIAASDGEEALRQAGSVDGRIDLLLSDVVMPGIGGRELAERLREVQPEAAVLHMSGYTDDAVIRRGVLERGAAFIEKPFSAVELGRRVRQLLDART